MQNNVSLVGRIYTDLEVKVVNGTKFCVFILKVKRPYRNKNGIYESDYISCIIYNQGADMLVKRLVSNQLVSITGEFRTKRNEYKGFIYYTQSILISKFSGLEPPQKVKPKPKVVNEEDVKLEELLETLGEIDV